MILSLSVVIIAAVVAAIALFFFLGSSIHELKKQQILVILGFLVLMSILISNFKSQDIFTFSLLNSVSRNKINSIFADKMPRFLHKYTLDQSLLGDYLFDRNYLHSTADKDYTQFVIYLSEKDHGASYFLYQLAEKLRAKGEPTFYVKMESPSGTSQEFFRKSGLSSFDAFKGAIQYYLQQNTRPYIIVDNAELLPRHIWQILSQYDERKSPHIIFNSENVDALLQRISEVDDDGYKLTEKDAKDQFLNRFQVQKFVGPDQVALEKLSPTNWFTKKLPINFETINHFKSGATEQQVLLKNSNADNIVANYFGLSNYYSQIKRLLQRGPLSFGKLKQANIPYEIIQQMEKLRMLVFRNGQVMLE